MDKGPSTLLITAENAKSAEFFNKQLKDFFCVFRVLSGERITCPSGIETCWQPCEDKRRPSTGIRFAPVVIIFQSLTRRVKQE